MKTYDFRNYSISEIIELVKGHRDCKIILTSQQYQKLPSHVPQLCYYRNIFIELRDEEYPTIFSDNTQPENCVSNLDFNGQLFEWGGFSIPSSGSFLTNYGYEQLPDNVFFNDKKKATTLMFYNEATVVKCGEGDKYSRRVGFLEAYFQATCGLSKTQAKKYLDKIVEDKEVKKK